MIHEFPDPTATETITYEPSFEALRSLSEELETTTEYGSPSYVSEKRSRSADRTKNAVDDVITADDQDHIERAHEALREREFVCVDRRMGRHPELSFVCRLFVPERYARIALSWATLLEPPEGDPDLYALQIPE
jgi:phosphoenolpyruvate carboxykinase (ATP)